MSNQSTIWQVLSAPNAASGSIPFVDIDNVSIITDVVNFFYDQTLLQLKISNGLKVVYEDKVSTPGAVTINKISGRVRIAAAGSSLVLTNSFIAAADMVICNLLTVDATAKSVVAVPAAGSCTFTLDAAATGAVDVDFFVVKRSTT